MFADFSADGEPRTLAADLTVDGAAAHAAAPRARGHVPRPTGSRAPARPAGRGARRSRSPATARPSQLDDYLGAKGHLVALREGDLAFLHVHPDEDRLRFMAEFPTAGRYRLFLQFQVDGSVHTAAFTHEVTR